MGTQVDDAGTATSRSYPDAHVSAAGRWFQFTHLAAEHISGENRKDAIALQGVVCAFRDSK